jgi:Organic solute transport protein 1
MSGAYLNVLPFVILNLGGEMIYILDQRLRAQEIGSERSQKVLQDVVKTMLSKKFVEELFRP